MKEYYDRRAPDYDDWYHGRGRYGDRDADAWAADLDAVLQTIASLAPVRTLDVACGTGFLTRHLRGEVVGLDQSTSMLDEARRQAPHATYVQAEGLELPFPDHSFGRVFSGHFYGHLDEAERLRFLEEARRVAPELVLVDAAERPNHEREEIQHRLLSAGSEWPILKRYFTAEVLRDELGGGDVLHDGAFFVVVRTPPT